MSARNLQVIYEHFEVITTLRHSQNYKKMCQFTFHSVSSSRLQRRRHKFLHSVKVVTAFSWVRHQSHSRYIWAGAFCARGTFWGTLPYLILDGKPLYANIFELSSVLRPSWTIIYCVITKPHFTLRQLGLMLYLVVNPTLPIAIAVAFFTCKPHLVHHQSQCFLLAVGWSSTLTVSCCSVQCNTGTTEGGGVLRFLGPS